MPPKVQKAISAPQATQNVSSHPDDVNILVIGDPHFKIDNVKDTNKMTSRILEIAKNLKSENRLDLIVNLGDTLDRHESIHVDPLNRATKFMSDLQEIAPTVLIIGNHDRPNNSVFLTEEHPFNALKKWSNITVVDKVTALTIKNRKFLFVSYVYPGRFFEAIDTLPLAMDPRPDMVFSHQEYLGAKMGVIKSEIGDEWPLDFPYNISGHVHDFDQLQPNLMYAGTPIQHGFADKNNKAILTVTIRGTSSTPIIEKIKLGVANKTTLRVTTKEAMDLNIDDLVKDGSEVRVVIKGTTAEISSVIKREELKVLAGQAKVVYDNVTEEVIQPVVEGESFLKKLWNICPEDTKKIYNEIFS
jgi:DNA repair exonuclease SbcCD nuclease subunit